MACLSHDLEPLGLLPVLCDSDSPSWSFRQRLSGDRDEGDSHLDCQCYNMEHDLSFWWLHNLHDSYHCRVSLPADWSVLFNFKVVSGEGGK